MADRSIAVRVKAIVSDFQRGMGQASDSVKGFRSDVMGMSRTHSQEMTTVGLAAAGAGLAIAGGLGAGVKAAVDWESAFAGVIKTVDATDAELDVLEQGLRDMAQEIPASHAELAGIAEAAGQLGISTGGILDFTRTMADLGVATNLTSEEAATMFARFANITGLPESEIENLGSAVVDLGNNSATTEREIGEMGLRIAGAGSQIGLQESEILGFAAALSSVGIEAQAGGTAISRTMIEIDKSVRSGDDRLQTFAETAGMTAEQFRTAYEDDAAGAIVTFIEGLGEISDSGGDVFGVLEDLELQDIRVRDALLRASGAGDLFRESIELGSEAFEANTALGEEAERRYETVASQIQIAKNAIVEMGIAIGEVLLPVVVPLIETARDLAKWFSDLPGPVKTAGVALAGISATLLTIGGTALIVLPRIVALVDAFNRLKAAQAGSALLAGAGAAARFAGTAALGGAAIFGGIQLGEFVGEKVLDKPGGFGLSLRSAFDDNAKTALRFQEAMHNVDKALKNGEQPALAFQNSLAHLAESGDLSTKVLQGLANRAGVTVDDVDAFASSMEDQARKAGMSEEAIDLLVDSIMGIEGPTGDAAEAMRDSGSSAGEYEVKTRDAADATRDLEEAHREMVSAMNEALSPIAAAQGAVQRLQEAESHLNEVRADSEATAEDVAEAEWGFVESLWAAQGALDQIDPSQLDTALEGIATALNISKQEAIELLEQLGILDGTEVDTVITTTYRTVGSAAAGTSVTAGGLFGSAGMRAAGGPVSANAMYRVGEGNMPELLKTDTGLFMIPGDQGRVFSNSDSQSMMRGGDRNMNVTFVNPRLADDPFEAVRSAFAFDTLSTV